MFGPQLFDVVRYSTVADLTIETVDIKRSAEHVKASAVAAPESDMERSRAPLRHAHYAKDDVLALRGIVYAGYARQFPVWRGSWPTGGSVGSHGERVINDFSSGNLHC